MADLLSERAQALIDAARGGLTPAPLAKHSAAGVAACDGDALLSELCDDAPTVTVIRADGSRASVLPAEPSPTAPPGLRYTPIELIEFLIAHPGMPLKSVASAFGRTMSWLSSVVASDSFQSALDPRRGEVLDPFFTATMDERFRALALRSGHILLEKLDQREVSDHVVLKATELSIKALGMGIAPPVAAPAGEPKLTVAEKMEQAMAEMDRRQAERTLDITLTEVKNG